MKNEQLMTEESSRLCLEEKKRSSQGFSLIRLPLAKARRSCNLNAYAFSLIELLVVIAIVGVLGLMTTVFYSRFIIQNSVANMEDSLSATLRKAQMYSMMGKQNSNWGVTLNSGKIVLFSGNTYATRNSAFDETISYNTAISISGFSDVIFIRISGIPNTTPTITISGNNSTEQVQVNNQGVVLRN